METTTKPDESNWTEARLQQECFLWHHQNYPAERGLLFTVDNNANDLIKGAVRKAVGRVAGVSDMIYLHCHEGASTAHFIELKLPGKKQSPDQKKWEQLVNRNRFDYYVITSLEQFQDMIEQIQSSGYYLPF